MNYLAHAFLSFNNPEVLLGNMISDHVKGKSQYEYPLAVQVGIKLHRAIDDFTDQHAATAALKNFFRPAYRLYSGAFADVVYDYFLANDTTQFASSGYLMAFATGTYALMEKNDALFPVSFAKMFSYMRQQNWLYNYRFDEGMQKSFAGLGRRAAYITETDTAYNIFIVKKREMQICYDNFFDELKNFTAHKLNELRDG